MVDEGEIRFVDITSSGEFEAYLQVSSNTLDVSNGVFTCNVERISDGFKERLAISALNKETLELELQYSNKIRTFKHSPEDIEIIRGDWGIRSISIKNLIEIDKPKLCNYMIHFTHEPLPCILCHDHSEVIKELHKLRDKAVSYIITSPTGARMKCLPTVGKTLAMYNEPVTEFYTNMRGRV